MSTLRADTCASARGPPTWSRTYPRTLLVVVCAHAAGASVVRATRAAIATRAPCRSALNAILLMSTLLYELSSVRCASLEDRLVGAPNQRGALRDSRVVL